MARNPIKVNQTIKKAILEKGKKGVSDGIIANKLGLPRYLVQRVTTQYWEEKMKQTQI